MAEPNAGNSADDTGIPADMLADGEIGKEPSGHGDVNGLASRLGWKPKEQWRGPDDKWIDAGQFVEKVEKETPVLRERLRFQDDMISRLQSDLSETAGRTKEQGEYIRELLERDRNREVRGFTRVRSDIDAQIEKAVAEADVPTAKRLMAERDELDKYRPAIEQHQQRSGQDGRQSANGQQPNGRSGNGNGNQQTVDPETTRWVSQNEWFQRDEELNDAAVLAEKRIARHRPGLSTWERLEAVKADVQQRYPEKFENPARRQPGAVAQPGAQQARAPKPKGKTVADLDEHGKEALARFKRIIPGYTDDEFLKTYKWDK